MERLSMRKIRECLRLRCEAGLSSRQIAASLQVSRSSVGEYMRRFAAAGLSWPLPAALSDTELERKRCLRGVVDQPRGLCRSDRRGVSAKRCFHNLGMSRWTSAAG